MRFSALLSSLIAVGDDSAASGFDWNHFVHWVGHFHPAMTAFPIALVLAGAARGSSANRDEGGVVGECRAILRDRCRAGRRDHGAIGMGVCPRPRSFLGVGNAPLARHRRRLLAAGAACRVRSVQTKRRWMARHISCRVVPGRACRCCNRILRGRDGLRFARI